jgi:hypothetical protein
MRDIVWRLRKKCSFTAEAAIMAEVFIATLLVVLGAFVLCILVVDQDISALIRVPVIIAIYALTREVVKLIKKIFVVE